MGRVAGVGGGVGVGVAVGVADGVAAALAAGDPPGPPLQLALTSLMMSAAALRLSTAPASATPPTVRNCRLVATADRMSTMVRGVTFRKRDARRHGIERCSGRG